MYGYERPSNPSTAFMQGAEYALSGGNRHHNPWGFEGDESKEWDRGFMAAVEHVFIRSLVEPTDS